MDVASLSVKELKKLLGERGISSTGLLEKQDLIAALLAIPSPPSSSSSSDRMSTSELKELLRQLAGRTTGLFERRDVLQRCRELLGQDRCSICLDSLVDSSQEPQLVFTPCCPLSKGVYHAACLQTHVLKSAEDGRWLAACVGCGKKLDEHTVKCKIFRDRESDPDYTKYLGVVAKLKELREQKGDAQEIKGLDPRRFRQCPRCKVWIEKGPAAEYFGVEVPGCNKMTCRCGHQFCFNCGADRDRCTCTSADHQFFTHDEVIRDYPGTRFSF